MKVHVPFLGKVTGSSAGLIYQSYWGKSFARTFPAIFHYPDTPRQQATQAKFYQIQKLWTGIYADIKQFIGPSQKKNRNTYNELFKYVFRNLNPYDRAHWQVWPNNFGLDKLNRVRAVINPETYTVTSDSISLDFSMGRPWVGIDVVPRDAIFIFFNRTRQDLAATILPFRGDLNNVTVPNDNEWDGFDNTCLYVALGCDGWLGNFNMVYLVFK